MAVVELEEPFDDTVSGLLFDLDAEGREVEVIGQGLLVFGREVGEGCHVPHAFLVQPLPHLLGAEGGQAKEFEGVSQLGEAEAEDVRACGHRKKM